MTLEARPTQPDGRLELDTPSYEVLWNTLTTIQNVIRS